MEALTDFISKTGFMLLLDNWKCVAMILIAAVLLYLAIVKKFEPMLLIPIAFGMLLVNLPGSAMIDPPSEANNNVGGLFYYLSYGVEYGIYPTLIFLGVGAMTDFGPLIANPKSLLLGAAAQFGIFIAFFLALLLGFSPEAAASIGIIGGADGPTTIFTTARLYPDLLSTITIAAYSYMALVPFIQPPIMRALTTKKERSIVMSQLRPVSKQEKIIFPIVVTVFTVLLLPSAAPLLGMLMFGNLLKEIGNDTFRLFDAASNGIMNAATIFLGLCVGATMTVDAFINVQTLGIVAGGFCAFALSIASGICMAKVWNLFAKKKINPLIGATGLSAVPMASRVCNGISTQYDPKNHVLNYCMSSNISGVIGSAVAAGVLISYLG